MSAQKLQEFFELKKVTFSFEKDQAQRKLPRDIFYRLSNTF